MATMARRAFELIDKDGNGKLSRAEVILAVRRDVAVRVLLGLPATIRQEDGSRDAFERVFQAIDADDSKQIDAREFERFVCSLAPPVTAAAADADADVVATASAIKDGGDTAAIAPRASLMEPKTCDGAEGGGAAATARHGVAMDELEPRSLHAAMEEIRTAPVAEEVAVEAAREAEDDEADDDDDDDEGGQTGNEADDEGAVTSAMVSADDGAADASEVDTVAVEEEEEEEDNEEEHDENGEGQGEGDAPEEGGSSGGGSSSSGGDKRHHVAVAHLSTPQLRALLLGYGVAAEEQLAHSAYVELLQLAGHLEVEPLASTAASASASASASSAAPVAVATAAPAVTAAAPAAPPPLVTSGSASSGHAGAKQLVTFRDWPVARGTGDGLR